MKRYKQFQKRRYRRAMMKAINIARRETWGSKKATRTDGLRVIRRFEKVNRCKFDPFDRFHVELIEGRGEDEWFFRKAKMILRKSP